MNGEFDAWPRVAWVGDEVAITVRDRRDPPSVRPGRDYTARFFSKVDRTDDGFTAARADTDGALRVSLRFRAQGEYTLDVRPAGEDNTENNKEPPLLSVKFFAASRGLARLRPWKGDVHMHTKGSDGANTPLEMVVAARAAGADFAAVTDHDHHEPSVGAVRDASALGGGFIVLRGEEATIPERGGHVLALDTAAGVRALRSSGQFAAELEALAAELAGRPLVSPLTPRGYAHAVWTVNAVRRAGGVALMAHPYWEGSRGKFYPPRCIFEQLLQDGLLDGVELVGGSPATEGNLLCAAKYADEIARGQRWAVAGGSDAHGTAEVGRRFTVVFAQRLSERDVVQALRDRRSVACDATMGPTVAVFGPFELVEYAYFLLREYFPEHDRLCAAQAAGWSRDGVDAASRRADADAVERDLAAWREGFWDEPELRRRGCART